MYDLPTQVTLGVFLSTGLFSGFHRDLPGGLINWGKTHQPG